jgi:tetratricopeptide (TPR) repeat protein
MNGRIDDAIAEFEIATDIDPLSPVKTALHGLALAIDGSAEAAIERAQHAVSLDPLAPVTRFMLGAVFLYTARYDEAIPELESARELAPNVATVPGLLGYAYAATGQSDRARAILASIDSADASTGNAAAIARIYIGLKDYSTALDWLHRAADAHDPFFGSEPMASPLFDPIRNDPRFGELIAKVNLDPEMLTRGR